MWRVIVLIIELNLYLWRYGLMVKCIAINDKSISKELKRRMRLVLKDQVSVVFELCAVGLITVSKAVCFMSDRAQDKVDGFLSAV